MNANTLSCWGQGGRWPRIETCYVTLSTNTPQSSCLVWHPKPSNVMHVYKHGSSVQKTNVTKHAKCNVSYYTSVQCAKHAMLQYNLECNVNMAQCKHATKGNKSSMQPYTRVDLGWNGRPRPHPKTMAKDAKMMDNKHTKQANQRGLKLRHGGLFSRAPKGEVHGYQSLMLDSKMYA